MNVKRLKELLHNAPDHAEVVVQMNVEGEEDSPGEATHTNALGDVYEAWLRNPDEFVIDAKQTYAEGCSVASASCSCTVSYDRCRLEDSSSHKDHFQLRKLEARRKRKAQAK